MTSPIGVLYGEAICSLNTTVEFTCTASSVEFLIWEKRSRTANIEIEDLTVRDISHAPFMRSLGLFTVFLDSGNTGADGLLYNIASRLVTTIDQGLNSGDEIICTNGYEVMESLTLNYSRLMGRHYSNKTSSVTPSLLLK